MNALGRKATPVRRDGGIDHLNQGSLFCLIQFGHFKLPGQNVKNGLVVLEVTNLAQILEACYRNLPLWHQESRIAGLLGPPQFRQLAPQGI